MLVLSVKDGDVVIVNTPAGPVRLHISPGTRHRRVGIDAPREWKVEHERNGALRYEHAPKPVETSTCTVKDLAALRVSSTASRRARDAQKGALGPRGASAT